MTNPPPPPASAMGLVARWRRLAEACKENGWFTAAETNEDCADELAAALSLSEDERNVLARLDATLAEVAANEKSGGHLLGYSSIAAYTFMNIHGDTLRALIARVTGDKA